MKPIKEKELEKVVQQQANYYRHSRLYTDYFDVNDAYDKYIESYTETMRLIISLGHSYSLKDNYLVAVDYLKFKQDYPEVFEHYFGPIQHRVTQVFEKEKHPVMFICAAAPRGNQFDPIMYKLINEFVAKYGRNYVIYTDCAIEIDFRQFTEYTDGRKILIAGGEYFRWSKERA